MAEPPHVGAAVALTPNAERRIIVTPKRYTAVDDEIRAAMLAAAGARRSRPGRNPVEVTEMR